MPEQPVPEAVRYLASRYEHRCLLSLAELTEAGMAGYRRAREKFDPTGGVDFADYAYWWVKQAITRAIVDRPPSLLLGQ
jgi:RNA polymerase nonessential primary-like sigma factor